MSKCLGFPLPYGNLNLNLNLNLYPNRFLTFVRNDATLNLLLSSSYFLTSGQVLIHVP